MKAGRTRGARLCCGFERKLEAPQLLCSQSQLSGRQRSTTRLSFTRCVGLFLFPHTHTLDSKPVSMYSVWVPCCSASLIQLWRGLKPAGCHTRGDKNSHVLPSRPTPYSKGGNWVAPFDSVVLVPLKVNPRTIWERERERERERIKWGRGSGGRGGRFGVWVGWWWVTPMFPLQKPVL